MGNRIYLYAERQGEYEMLSEAKYELPPIWRLLLAAPSTNKKEALALKASKKGLASLQELLNFLAKQPDFQAVEGCWQLFDAIEAYLSVPMAHFSVALAELYGMEDAQPEAVFLSDVKASIVSFQQSALALIAAEDRPGLNTLFGVENAQDWLSQTGLTWWEDEYFWQDRWQTQSWADYLAAKAIAPIRLTEGLEAFCESGKWGVRSRAQEGDETSVVLAAPFADEILPFDGEAPITAYRQGARWGLLQRDGTLLTSPQYDVFEGVHGGVAIVQVAAKFGLVKLDGQWLSAPQYDDAYGFDEGLAPVSLQGKWGMLGLTGEIVIPIELDDIHSASRLREQDKDGIRFLAKQGGWGLMDEQGQWIQPPVYDEVQWQQGSLPGWEAKQQRRVGRWSPLGTEWLACQWESVTALPLGEGGRQLAWLVELSGAKGVLSQTGEVWLPCEFEKIKALDAIEEPVRPGYYRFWQVTRQGKSTIWDLETRQQVLGMTGLKTVLPLVGESVAYLLGVDKQTQQMRFYTATGQLMFPYQFEWVHQADAHAGAGWHWKGILDLHCLREWITGRPFEAMIGKGLKTSAALTGSVWLFPDGNLIPDAEWQLPLANAGQAEACYRMGCHAQSTDPAAAGEWFRRAADQQHEAAMAEYAYHLCEHGNGEADVVKARALYEAVQHRFPWVQNNLACQLQHGEGGEKDEKRAFELFRRSAERGVVVAMRNLGEAHRYGRGTPVHLPTAIRWFESAAEAGDHFAAGEAATLLLSDEQAADGTRLQQEKRRARALTWARMAAEDGRLSTLLVLVEVLTTGQDPAEREEARTRLLARQAEHPDPVIADCLEKNGW